MTGSAPRSGAARLLVISPIVAGFAQSLAEPATNRVHGPGELQRKPITGIAFCWASRPRAAVIAPPRRSTSSRRLTRSPRRRPLRSRAISSLSPHPALPKVLVL